MKRFVLPELAPYYALFVIAALIAFLTRTGGIAAYLAAIALFMLGTGIVFRPKMHRPTRRECVRALLGAGRSRGSR